MQDPRASKTKKQQAIKFLIHFITDLHQPLHVGDTGKKGGNLIQVRFFNVGSNLHRVWDSQIIEWHSRDEGQWLRELSALMTPKNVVEWSKRTLEDWATESLQIAKEAYCIPGAKTVMRSGTKLGDDYCRMALPLIQRQLAMAGIRVAWMLNEIFR